MIPKIIHYCWFGHNQLPELAEKCIESWKKYLPDYEIKEWNEENFDLEACIYVKEAYAEKKWAFVSDYARFWIIYNYGGLYFDTDVEIIKPIADIIERGAFMGLEKQASYNTTEKVAIAAGLGIGAEEKNPIYKEILDGYAKRHFLYSDGRRDETTVVSYITDIFQHYGWQKKNKYQVIQDINLYPTDYFCPMDFATGEIELTENTRSIHHYTATWQSPSMQKVVNIMREWKKAKGIKRLILYIELFFARLINKISTFV